MLLAGGDRLPVAGPGLWVRAVGTPSGERGVWDLGWLAVALLGAPAQPLSEVSYVLSICNHVGIFELSGEHSWCSPLRPFLERDIVELLFNTVGLFGRLYHCGLSFLGPMGSYGPMFRTVAFAGLLRDHHRLEPLADEILGIEFLVGREP